MFLLFPLSTTGFLHPVARAFGISALGHKQTAFRTEGFRKLSLPRLQPCGASAASAARHSGETERSADLALSSAPGRFCAQKENRRSTGRPKRRRGTPGSMRPYCAGAWGSRPTAACPEGPGRAGSSVPSSRTRQGENAFTWPAFHAGLPHVYVMALGASFVQRNGQI